jgi:hypothetical protein
VYGAKTAKQFINTLEDNITTRGAPHKLLHNSAQVLICNKVQDILRNICIKSWQSDPHHQQQNPAEPCYQTIKHAENRVLDPSGALHMAFCVSSMFVIYFIMHIPTHLKVFHFNFFLILLLTLVILSNSTSGRKSIIKCQQRISI